MIIYFTSTGNCEYVSKRIAERTHDYTVSMIESNKNKQFEFHLEKQEPLGIVIPTYFWGLPTFVEDYMSQIKITSENNNPYIYIITSYGTTPGYSAGYLEEYITDINLEVSFKASVKMPDDWTVRFDLSDPEKISKQILEADKQINNIIPRIVNKESGNYVKREIPRFISNMARGPYDKGRKTSHLHVENNCTGCGICANNCPIDAIELIDNRPHWKTEYCVMCLRCLHHCPTFSIQYDNKTQNHGQYIHPKI